MKQSTFIIFLTVVLFTDKIHAVVFNVFGNLQDRNEFACNTKVILQCIVNANKNPVLWRVGNPIDASTSAAAQCSGNSCNINSAAVSSKYNFSYNENSGDTNMTITNVTLAEDGKQYMCDDGSTSSIFDSVVQVPPIKETTKILNKTMSENTIITCSTGCVTNRTAQLVTFKWYKIDLNGRVSVYKDATPPSSSDDSPCQINSDCISDGSVELSDNFTITEDVTASEEVYFQVHILLNGVFFFSVNSSTFRLKSGQDSTTNTNPFTNQTIAGTPSATVSFSTEVGSNATTETVIFNTTANSTVYPSNEKFEMTYIFVITIIGVVVLGAAVVVLFLFVLRRKQKKRKSDKSDGNSNNTFV